MTFKEFYVFFWNRMPLILSTLLKIKADVKNSKVTINLWEIACRAAIFLVVSGMRREVFNHPLAG